MNIYKPNVVVFFITCFLSTFSGVSSENIIDYIIKYKCSPLSSLHRESYPELQEQLGELRRHLLESTNDMAPLKVWELQGKHFAFINVPLFNLESRAQNVGPSSFTQGEDGDLCTPLETSR